MNPKLSDDAVADLPLHQGRAELLKEIMSTPLLDHDHTRDHDTTTTATAHARRRRAWVVPAAAAALVAALVTTPAWWGSWDASPGQAQVAGGGDEAAAPAGFVVLDADGWRVDYAQVDDDGGSLSYSRDGRSLEITRYPAALREGYVEDRRHIVDPPADGEPVELIGRSGALWAYGPRDHTVISDARDGSWIEVRGQGMPEDDYLALLDGLRLVGVGEFESALPDDFVTGGERAEAVEEIIDGIGAVAQPLLPPGVPRSSITTDQVDPYSVGVDIGGGLACVWLDEFEEATLAGDEERSSQAAAVLATSRLWPVLQQMDERGDYPEVVWEYADQVNKGEVPEGYAGGLGC